jgi:ketosteroid isomerase-like protein
MNYPDSYANDRAQIEDLMSRYLFAMDYNDFDTYADTFTEDGTLNYATGIITGRENIRAEAKAFKERVGTMFTDIDGKPSLLRHVLTHSTIRVDGDKAWHTGFWFEFDNGGERNAAGRKTILMGTFGIYEDELRRVDGEWKFYYRNIRNEFLDGRDSGTDNPVLRMDAKAEAGA